VEEDYAFEYDHEVFERWEFLFNLIFTFFCVLVRLTQEELTAAKMRIIAMVPTYSSHHNCDHIFILSLLFFLNFFRWIFFEQIFHFFNFDLLHLPHFNLSLLHHITDRF